MKQHLAPVARAVNLFSLQTKQKCNLLQNEFTKFPWDRMGSGNVSINNHTVRLENCDAL